MRVILVALLSAFAAVGCEKNAALSEGEKKSAPIVKPGANAPEGTGVGNKPGGDDETSGEPMDDVDEVESPLDKSGADKSGAADPEEEDVPEGDGDEEE